MNPDSNFLSSAVHLSCLSWQTSALTWQEYQIIQSRLFASGDEVDLRTLIAENCFSLELKAFVLESPWMEQNQKWMDWSEQAHAQILYPGHPLYPVSFFNLEEPPLALTYQGHACWQQATLLAVVGSREPRTESLIWMEQELGLYLQNHNVVTISGGARGIDQKCHALSLRHRRPTVIALPSGLGRLYPPTLSSWIQPVIEGGGALISCYAPDREMFKSQFRRRNQLIAQMASALLIVEAARRSGTYMTARLALEREGPIGVVPGHPLQNQFRGSLDLICDGVTPIRDAQDLKALVGSSG